MLTRRSVFVWILGAGGAAAWRRGAFSQTLTPQRAVAIAKDAFIFGYPMVAAYGAMFTSAIEKAGPLFKAPFNEIHHEAKVCSPQDSSVSTPNCDTCLSQLWADLRAEPLVIGMPAISQGRYCSAQFVDLYTWNFAYFSARASGKGGGKVLLAGPDWKGAMPRGVVRVIQSETEFALAIFRTQVIDPGDLANVKKIQAQYTVQALSSYLNKPAPAPAPPVIFPPFDPKKAKSLGFFDYVAFLLQFCPLRAADDEIRERAANIGVEPGAPFNPVSMWSEMREALAIGMRQGLKAIESNLAETKAPHELFGSRHSMKNNYLDRASAAMFELFGNSKSEVIEFSFDKDAAGQVLDGSRQYTIRFDKGQLPPVKAFWSLTLYDGKTKLPAENPIGRYVISSSMLSGLSRNAEGGITILVQKSPPPKERASNWLPAPAGPFFLSLRCYWPDSALLNGKWTAPLPVFVV